MLKYLELALFLGLLALAMPAFGADRTNVSFDPTDFLKEQEFKAAERRAAEAIETTTVIIGNQIYLRLSGKDGTIYVPKHETLEVEDLKLARCDSSFRPSDLALALHSASERRILEAVSRTKDVILDAIRSRCTNRI
jgi:hypothetical protein